MDKVYVEEPWLTLRWDDANRCVHSEWKAFANSKEYRAGLMKGLEAIRENHAVNYLTDTRSTRVIVREDQAWVKETWTPLAVAAGLKRVAVVLAGAGLGKVTVEETIHMVDRPDLEVRSFDSVIAAQRWLAES
ncbi:MAG: hypothetical protein E6J20_19730 [Chloroflexi bacterium]|nr:MAG: hypothetical protein E6J20_19730 [Chloroflexota bacterium]